MSHDRVVSLLTLSLRTFIMLMMAWTFWMIGPPLESRFFPVVGKLQILAINVGDDGKTRLMVAFEKKRDCSYVGITWFKKFDSQSIVRVPLILDRLPLDSGAQNRPIGKHVAGPWIVEATPTEIVDHSIVDVYHNCHLLWPTRTRIYP